MKELYDLKSRLNASLQKDVGDYTRLHYELKCLRVAIKDIGNKSMKLSFIVCKKSMEKIHLAETSLTDFCMNVERSIQFQANTDIVKQLSQHTGLGKIVELNPDQPITVTGKTQYSVAIPSDQHQSTITGICRLDSDHILVADYHNKRVKLVEISYRVISHCDVSSYPQSLCTISPCEAAVTDKHNINEVQFVSVNNGKLVMGRKLQLPHECYGIAHHHGDLYVTSGTALYQYTLSGTLAKKLYEDTSGGCTVNMCTVSRCGSRTYVTSYSNHMLLTLARDGTVLSTFTDPQLVLPERIHVTDEGQVLYFGRRFNTIIRWVTRDS